MSGTTSRFAFPYPSPTDPLKEGAAKIKAFAEGADAAILNRTYGKSIIATEQTHGGSSYGKLATPDEVEVTMPENGLIAVAYQATWKDNSLPVGRAAIFVGANQLKIASDATAPVTQAAGDPEGGTGAFRPLTSANFGLVTHPLTAAYTGDVTTGQALGLALDINTSLYHELGGTVQRVFNNSGGAAMGAVGGPCLIFGLTAGTYVISIQFKASSGAFVSVKNRKLWVWSMF